MRASIVIPTRDHAWHVHAAIESALAQAAPVEVVVVDDGSVDETQRVLAMYSGDGRVKLLRHGEPRGVATARNAGLAASTGDLVMFLDADDVIVPDKLKIQSGILEDAGIGWTFCDVNIVDVPPPPELWSDRQRKMAALGFPPKQTVTHASERYGYANRNLDGWLYKQLVKENFIPVHAPLVRRSAVEEAGPFNEGSLIDDWDFWLRLSCVARARYVPGVLATYFRHKGGRNHRPELRSVPNHHDIDRPAGLRSHVLYLNLGCGAPGMRSWHPMPGFLNLDPRTVGWKFEDGLRDFPDASVRGISVSHSLGCVEERHYSMVFAEFMRVLVPGGIVRITDGDLVAWGALWQGTDPYSTLIGPQMVLGHLRAVGFDAGTVSPHDGSVLDQHHHPSRPGAPDSFYVEGRKRA